jgi:hypothetical protein
VESPLTFSGSSNMARHLLFAISLMSLGGLLNSQAEAVTDAPHCENNAANCVGTCANPGGGTNNSKCMWRCDQHVIRCLVRAHDAAFSGGRR